MNSLPKISVVIPAYNEETYIEACVKSLTAQNYPREKYEIIVIDNNSKDNTSKIAREAGATVYFLKDGPVGAVRNYGVSKASGDIIAFIDSDCIAYPDWLTKGVSSLQSNKDTVFGGGYLLRDNANWLERSWLLGDKVGSVPKELVGGCIFITKKAFLSVSGFSTKVTSGEDTQLSVDLRNAGYNINVTPNLSVVHLGNPRTSTDFFLRQIWHSENYFRKFSESIKDPTFILISAFTLAVIALPISVFLNLSLTAPIIILLLLIPTAFSVKRIYRVGRKNIKPNEVPGIYFVDMLYVAGRMVGLLKGLILAGRKA